jgi:hypothetical protein
MSPLETGKKVMDALIVYTCSGFVPANKRDSPAGQAGFAKTQPNARSPRLDGKGFRLLKGNDADIPNFRAATRKALLGASFRPAHIGSKRPKAKKTEEGRMGVSLAETIRQPRDRIKGQPQESA